VLADLGLAPGYTPLIKPEYAGDQPFELCGDFESAFTTPKLSLVGAVIDPHIGLKRGLHGGGRAADAQIAATGVNLLYRQTEPAQHLLDLLDIGRRGAVLVGEFLRGERPGRHCIGARQIGRFEPDCDLDIGVRIDTAQTAGAALRRPPAPWELHMAL
jgi:hypothetical protein